MPSPSERPEVWDRSDDGFCARLNILICEQQMEVHGEFGSGRFADEVNGISTPD